MSMTLTRTPKQLDLQPAIEPVRRRDHTIRWLVLATSLVSVAAYIYFQNKGVVLGYKDSISHLQIAQRMINSPTAGFAQLGGVWLPLPHLLMIPLVWIEPLYYSGFAGSIISMISYVVASVYLYKIVFGLTKLHFPPIVGVAVFALNPNILYMQSTAMTELLLFATLAASVYYVQKWIQTNWYGYLFVAAFALTLGCLTRYEAWILTVALTAVVAIVAFVRFGYKRAEGTVLGFMFLAWSAIIGWVGWNWLILGNPLNWQTGEYAKPSLWVNSQDPSVGHIWVACKTYWFALVHDFGLPVIIASLVGVGFVVFKRRQADILPTLCLGIFVPFFIYAIYGGQRPMNVLETSESLYNLRFGLIMGLFAAIVIGYLVGYLPTLFRVLVAATVVIFVFAPVFGGPGEIITVQETQSGLQRTIGIAPNEVSNFLSENYRGGKILAESFGNETILFDAEISLGNNIYEGSYQQWEPALDNPNGYDIDWIIMRSGDSPDKVYKELASSEKLEDYTLVFQNNLYFVYERN